MVSLKTPSKPASSDIKMACVRAALVCVRPLHSVLICTNSTATACLARPSARMLALRNKPTTATVAISAITAPMNTHNLVEMFSLPKPMFFSFCVICPAPARCARIESPSKWQAP